MTPFYQDEWLQVWGGDARVVLRELPAGSVHCVVTSPPFWGLRDYGTATWEGGDPGCDHALPRRRTYGPTDAKEAVVPNVRPGDPGNRLCARCGAHRIDAQLGLEATPEEYVAALVDVFREVRRVLRDDGTVFLNLGDSYASTGGERTYGSSDGGTGRGPGTRRYRPVAGGSDPSQSPQPERAPAYGTDGTAPRGLPGPGSAYPDLCGECRSLPVAWHD